MKKMKLCADATTVGLPFICINEGEFAGLVFLIDTGAMDNIIFGHAYKQIKDLLNPVEGNKTLYGLDGEPQSVHCASGKLTLCGKQHEMMFLIQDENNLATRVFNGMGFPVAGIIGTNFMVEHDWVIDFAHQEILVPDTDVSVEEFKRINK